MGESNLDIDDPINYLDAPWDEFVRKIRASKGHKTIDQIVQEQGTKPFDPSSLPKEDLFEPGEFEEFLETLREWRGHKRTTDAA